MRWLLFSMRRSLASPARNTRLAVVVGRLLAAAFLICFATGLYSHFLQEPLPWMRFSTRPATLYQLSQGVHVAAGIACFPLLLGKLYVIFPQLFQSPPIRGPLHLLERASIAVFVGASLVQITIGLVNTYQWYPWPFGFREVHWSLSFVLIGSLALHIALKLPLISRYWRRSSGYAPDEEAPTEAPVAALGTVERAARGVTGRVFAWIDTAPDAPDATSRRGFLVGIGAATAAVVLFTAGQSFALLRPLNLFAPRAQGIGQQGVPVNRTADAAQVTATAVDPDWTLTVVGPTGEVAVSRPDLLALPQTAVDLPIACVEGWSQMARWRGVRIRDLLALVGADGSSRLRITSLEARGGYRVTEMGPEFAQDPATLVALELEEETLDIEHGYPARIIAPGRPGVLQTKWLSRIEVIR